MAWADTTWEEWVVALAAEFECTPEPLLDEFPTVLVRDLYGANASPKEAADYLRL